MRTWGAFWVVVVLLGAAPAPGAAPPGHFAEEYWEAVLVDGAKVGFVHTTVEALDGGKRLRATADLNLTFRRHNALLRLRMEHGTEEGADGKVRGVFMRQYHDRERRLNLVGALEEGRMHVTIDGGRIERRLPWSDEVVGLYGQERLFRTRKVKPGDRFTFPRYEPTLNTVVTVRVAVKERETFALPGGKKELLRVELTPDKIEVPGLTVRPAPSVWWLDERFVPVRRQTEMEGLGTLVLTRAPRTVALAVPTAPGRLADIGLKTLVPLNRTIPRPYATREAVYRITLRGDPDPGTALAQDGHQDIRNVRGNTFELHVHPVRPGTGDRGDGEAPAECLASCRFINWDDARVKELAGKAVGGETDPWRKAVRIERWVKTNMRPDNAAPLAPAGVVARTLRGDCRLYALLTAALCRAEDIPARTAVGLLYVEKGGRPQLGFHMWTEVWVEGRWLGLDGTLGRGGVGATHLKIADHSWHKTESLTPLLPVGRVLGKIAVRVETVE